MNIDNFLRIAVALGLLAVCLPSTMCASDVSFTQVFFDKQQITVEVVGSEYKRALGLMHRRHLGQGMGMLFLFSDSDYRSFWMKNTLIELDIIYLGADKRIVDIHRRVPPCQADPCPSYPSALPAQYVLELDGGEADRLKMRNGDRLDFVIPSGTVVE